MNLSHYVVAIILSALLVACGGTHRATNHVVVDNPYTQRMKDMTHLGVNAMQKERWGSAENAFKHALKAAKLTNNPTLIVAAWHNISMVHKAMWLQHQFALVDVESDLMQLVDLANKYDMREQAIGAQLQLDILKVKSGQTVVVSNQTLPEGLSAAVYLTAARLAQLQGDTAKSELLYHKVLQLTHVSRSGLILKAQAYTGLGLLAEKLKHEEDAQKYAMQALSVCMQVGAPRISANASLLLARLKRLSEQERMDYAKRALDIYQLLHEVRGAVEAKALLRELSHG